MKMKKQRQVWSEIEYQIPGIFWIGGLTLDGEWDWSDGTFWSKNFSWVNWAPN